MEFLLSLFVIFMVRFLDMYVCLLSDGSFFQPGSNGAAEPVSPPHASILPPATGRLRSSS